MAPTGRKRNLSPWAYWRLRHDALVDEDPCPIDGDQTTFDAWRARAAARLDALLAPTPESVSLDIEVRSTDDGPGYAVENIVFDAEPAMSVPALLLVPDERRAPGPAVLAVHGHGHTNESICGLDGGRPEVRDAIARDHADYGHRLASLGYVVLAPDLRCFGERADWQPDDRYHCDLNLVHAYAAGENPMAQNVWDLRRCLDVLAGHPLVDPTRLGMAGWSYGGTLTTFVAAVDQRVAVAVVSCAFSSFRSMHRVPWNLCGSQVLPGMLGKLEHRDLAALTAPRPLFVSSGRDDILFPADVATKEIEMTRRVYAALDVDDGRLAHVVFDGDHRWDAAPAEAFLARWL
jgi:dienelactone hydrolase